MPHLRSLPLSVAVSLALAASTAPTRLAAQKPDAVSTRDPAATAAIRAAALDYIQGWYGGDAERMARAVHPMLAKRIAEPGPDGRTRIEHMTAEELVAGTRRGGGRNTQGARRAEVRVLDVFGDAASVRVDADAWVDYLQLARVDGRWQIVNVLWALRPSTSAGR
ncbi:MAG TPA: nuclear transport factor 2 family protein [Gemmatirosa sp.]|nr:nuclear transport factor 2 family protein [Gemmatirosa sp.]